jgi:hypothetical protein
MISDGDWGTLTAAARGSAGVAWRRIHADSGHDLYIAVRQPGDQRCLWFDLPADAIEDHSAIASLRSVHVEVRHKDDAGSALRCEMALTSADLADVFSRLVEDVSAAVAAQRTDASAADALLTRLARWRRLLETSSQQGLTAEERRGLQGELVVLGELLDAGLAARCVVPAWTGPLHKNQDFQFSDAALEVKTTSAKQPQSVMVTNERELDPRGVDELFLVQLSLDERRGGTGESLPESVDHLRARLCADPGSQAHFDQLLARAGYLDEHARLYADTRYTVRTLSCFRVSSGFPAIIEGMLPAGVGDVKYRIQTAALRPFVHGWTEACQLLRGKV